MERGVLVKSLKIMPILQPIANIAELLYQKGITNVVISPGSRSAPLTMAVARHPKLKTRVVADERSAGFVALGMAMQSRRTVAVICTSGSAVYNLAPAVAEAFFQEVPLLLYQELRPRLCFTCSSSDSSKPNFP